VQIDDTKDGDTLIVSISGDIDLPAWQPLQDLTERLHVHPGPVVLDMSGVGFCDSIALRFLLATRERVPQLLLHEPSHDLRVVLSSAGLLEAFHVDA
jgi:anti-anti-sigma factor